ncbi:MAG: sigma-70 family RNA polymerase sigma factor [Bacteroidia bacterium]
MSSEDQNNQATISKWVAEYSDEMYSWAYYKTSNKEVAEDLVQESFLSALKYFDSFRKESNAKTWLFTILNNKIVDHYRSAANKRMVNESSYIKNEDSNLFDESGTWISPSSSNWDHEPHLLDRPEFLKVMQACIENLPERHKAVTMAKFFYHKKGSVICKELGISASNLWQIVHRSKLQLRACLDENWKNDE